MNLNTISFPWWAKPKEQAMNSKVQMNERGKEYREVVIQGQAS
jgi:hypothetical protein